MTGLPETRKPVDLVIASAGTGKTFRLVEEVQTALEAGAGPGSILATTFTNKAAAELVERARSKLIGEGHADEAAGLLSARVGTVNSVFGRIVGDFALNAGRSPVTDVIPEQHQGHVFAIAAESAIAHRASEMIPIAQRLDIEDWADHARKLAGIARRNDIDPSALKDNAERSWNGFRAILPERADGPGDALDAHLRDALAEVREALKDSSDQTKATAAVKQRIDENAAVLASGRDLPWSRWAALAKLKPAKGSVGLVQPVVGAAMAHAAHPRLHADLEAYIRGIYGTAAEALETYADYKAANGLVDFVDQEHEALRLLDNAEVAKHLRETLSRVFVDEFQDTSPIQLALFLKVSQVAERSFWVGDPKQAIFGFRGADPDLILQAARTIVPESGGRGETLPKSYRSRPALVDFTNRAFGPAFEALGFESGDIRIEEVHRGDGDGQTAPIEVWGLAGRTVADAMASAGRKDPERVGRRGRPPCRRQGAEYAARDPGFGYRRPLSDQRALRTGCRRADGGRSPGLYCAPGTAWKHPRRFWQWPRSAISWIRATRSRSPRSRISTTTRRISRPGSRAACPTAESGRSSRSCQCLRPWTTGARNSRT